MGGAAKFYELRAWQVARAFKLRVYEVIDAGPLTRDVKLCDQLREASRGIPSAIAEGFGRFDPADFARFVKIARASLLECQNHLQDACDRRLLSDVRRRSLDADAELVLIELGGLLDYLQSPAAKGNAERIRQGRFERRSQRVRNPEP